MYCTMIFISMHGFREPPAITDSVDKLDSGYQMIHWKNQITKDDCTSINILQDIIWQKILIMHLINPVTLPSSDKRSPIGRKVEENCEGVENHMTT